MPELAMAGGAEVEVVEKMEEKVGMDEDAIKKQEEDAKFIVDGPEQDVSKYNEKLLKVIIKEGGKRGVEIEGAADMGEFEFVECIEFLDFEFNYKFNFSCWCTIYIKKLKICI